MPANRTLGILLLLVSATSALAQTTVTGKPATGGASSASSGGQNAVARPNMDHVQDGKLESTVAPTNVKLENGANSFTEGEARRRLEKAGFRDIKDLKKDADGIWRASTTLDEKPVQVGLDFKGNVAAQ